MNNHFQVISNSRRLSEARLAGIALFVFLTGLLMGCTPADTTVPQVTRPIQVVGSDYEVLAHNDKAWASFNHLDPLDRLGLNKWESLVNNGRISTDEAGIAELRNTKLNCSGLYVFKQSGMQSGGCTPGGTGNWNCVVGAAASTNCDVGLASPSTNVTLNGTWVSLISLDQGQLSIVTVLKGQVKMVPVVRLEIRQFVKTDTTFVLDLGVRDLDDQQSILLNEGQSAYTAPDAYLQQLRARFNLPPARTPLGPDALQLLVNTLLPAYPLLQVHLEDIRLQAQTGGLVFPAGSPAQPVVNILIEGAGGFLSNNSSQQVVLIGVNWRQAQQVAFPGQTINFSFQLPGRAGLRDQAF